MIGWADVHKIGSTVYTQDGASVEITEQYAQRMISNFAACRERGYAVPVLRNHGRDDAWIYGEVVEMRVDGEFLQAGLEFTRDEESEAFRAKLMREFSPGFDTDWLDPHTGELMGPTLLELSFTSLAYQRNLRPPVDAAQLTRVFLHTFSRRLIMAEMPEDRILKLEEEIAALREIVAKLSESSEPEEMAEEPEELAVDEEKIEMSKRIRALEDTVVRQEIASYGVKDDVDSLVQLSRVDRKLFASTMKKLSRINQTEIGSVGVAEFSAAGDSVESVARAAINAGADGPGKMVLFLSKNYPTFVNRAGEIRRVIATSK